MMIKITRRQLEMLEDSIGDVGVIELEREDKGNLVVWPDGQESERYEITPEGDIE